MQRLRLSGGFQRGPQPSFGTRPCLQGIVCYTSAEGIGNGCQSDVLLMLSAAWMQIVFQQQRAHARTIPAAEVYRSPLSPFAFHRLHTMRKSVL